MWSTAPTIDGPVPDGQGGQPWYGVPPAVCLRRVKRSFDGAEEKDYEIL